MFIPGHFALLRPVGTQDAARLLTWSFTPDASHVLARRADSLLFAGPITDPEALWGRDMPLVIGDGDGSESTLGYTLLYDINVRDRHMSVEVFTTEQCPPLIEMEAWLLLLSHTFRWFPVEKLYVHIPEFRKCPLPAQLAGFDAEGFLARHIWFDDSFWGVQILGLTREGWSQKRERLVDNIAIQATYEQMDAREDASAIPDKRRASIVE